MVKRKRYLIWSMFIVYCGVMLWLLFGRSIHASGDDYVGSLISNINRIPFHTVVDQLQNLLNPPSPGLFTHAWINLGGNVAVFIPLGIFLPWIWPKYRRWGRFFLVSSGIILTVEFLQWITLWDTRRGRLYFEYAGLVWRIRSVPPVGTSYEERVTSVKCACDRLHRTYRCDIILW